MCAEIHKIILVINKLDAQLLFCICLFLFSTCFGQACAHHHHKHPGLGPLARSVSRVTVALSIVSSVSQLFSFLVGCSEMILKGLGFVEFFAGVKASSVFIYIV
jgi:hypothetical protein